jgi:hypothetical protein
MKARFAMGIAAFAAVCAAAPALSQAPRPQVTVAASAKQDLTEIWRTPGFRAPESVAFDPASRTLLVTNLAVNLAGPPPAAGGPPVREEATDGYVTQVGLDGKVIKERFVDGLDRPSGLTIKGGTLWVLAGDLVEIDLATQRIRNTFKRPEGAGRLTDLRVADDGRIFVTDMYDATIFVLERGQLTEWLKDAQLGRPNGIVIAGGTLFVNASGTTKAIDIATRKITPYGTAGVTGAGDDLVPVPGGLLAAAYQDTILVDKDGKVTQVLPIGVNGLEYVPAEELIVVTFLRKGEIAAYKARF